MNELKQPPENKYSNFSVNHAIIIISTIFLTIKFATLQMHSD
jgi:hypothetical protein